MTRTRRTVYVTRCLFAHQHTVLLLRLLPFWCARLPKNKWAKNSSNHHGNEMSVAWSRRRGHFFGRYFMISSAGSQQSCQCHAPLVLPCGGDQGTKKTVTILIINESDSVTRRPQNHQCSNKKSGTTIITYYHLKLVVDTMQHCY